VNAARGGAATALHAVADNGRLATITGDPPPPERGITVADVYVRADGARLAELVAARADGQLSLHVAATLPLTDAATALQSAVTGHAAGATVLALEQSPDPYTAHACCIENEIVTAPRSTQRPLTVADHCTGCAEVSRTYVMC
jgi:hypothetical protein